MTTTTVQQINIAVERNNHIKIDVQPTRPTTHTQLSQEIAHRVQNPLDYRWNLHDTAPLATSRTFRDLTVTFENLLRTLKEEGFSDDFLLYLPLTKEQRTKLEESLKKKGEEEQKLKINDEVVQKKQLQLQQHLFNLELQHLPSYEKRLQDAMVVFMNQPFMTTLRRNRIGIDHFPFPDDYDRLHRLFTSLAVANRQVKQFAKEVNKINAPNWIKRKMRDYECDCSCLSWRTQVIGLSAIGLALGTSFILEPNIVTAAVVALGVVGIYYVLFGWGKTAYDVTKDHALETATRKQEEAERDRDQALAEINTLFNRYKKQLAKQMVQLTDSYADAYPFRDLSVENCLQTRLNIVKNAMTFTQPEVDRATDEAGNSRNIRRATTKNKQKATSTNKQTLYCYLSNEQALMLYEKFLTINKSMNEARTQMNIQGQLIVHYVKKRSLSALEANLRSVFVEKSFPTPDVFREFDLTASTLLSAESASREATKAVLAGQYDAETKAAAELVANQHGPFKKWEHTVQIASAKVLYEAETEQMREMDRTADTDSGKLEKAMLSAQRVIQYNLDALGKRREIVGASTKVKMQKSLRLSRKILMFIQRYPLSFGTFFRMFPKLFVPGILTEDAIKEYCTPPQRVDVKGDNSQQQEGRALPSIAEGKRSDSSHSHSLSSASLSANSKSSSNDSKDSKSKRPSLSVKTSTEVHIPGAVSPRNSPPTNPGSDKHKNGTNRSNTLSSPTQKAKGSKTRNNNGVN